MSIVINLQASGTVRKVGVRSVAWQVERVDLLSKVSLGITELEPDDALPTNTHDYMEVFYVISGIGSLFSDGKRSVLRSGDLVLIPSGEEHLVENSSAENLIMLYIGLKNQ